MVSTLFCCPYMEIGCCLAEAQPNGSLFPYKAIETLSSLSATVGSTIRSFPITTPCYNITSEWLQWPPPIHVNHCPTAAQHCAQSRFYCTIYMSNTNILRLREN